MKDRKHFVAFLNKHGALEEYIVELLRNKGLSISEFFKEGRTEDHIGGAFVWANSRSKDAFWANLHQDWVYNRDINLNKNTRVI